MYLYLYLSNRPLGSPSVLIIRWWCTNPGAQARRALGSIPRVTLLFYTLLQYRHINRRHMTCCSSPMPSKSDLFIPSCSPFSINALTLPHRPCPRACTLPFPRCPSVSARCWVCPTPLAVVKLHWMPTSDKLQPIHGCPPPTFPVWDPRRLSSRSPTVLLVVLGSWRGVRGADRQKTVLP